MQLTNDDGINAKDFEQFKAYKEKHYVWHKRKPSSLAWNEEGSLLSTADNTIKIWSLGANGLERVCELPGNESNIDIDCLRFNNNNILGSLSRESLKLWDVREPQSKPLATEKKTKFDLIRFSWSNTSRGEGKQLALLTKETILLYDFRNINLPLGTIQIKHSSSFDVSVVEWDRTDSVMFIAGGEELTQLYRNTTGSILLAKRDSYETMVEPIIVAHCGKINDLVVDVDNTRIATCSEDSLVAVHTIPELICERVFSQRADSSFKAVSFSYNGKYIAASSEGATIDIYNVIRGGTAYRLKTSLQQDCLSWHPKKMILAYLDADEKRSLDREEPYVHLLQE